MASDNFFMTGMASAKDSPDVIFAEETLLYAAAKGKLSSTTLITT